MSVKKEIKEYVIDGLDCADCANHLEEVLAKIEGVKEAKINFVTARMQLVTDGRVESDKKAIHAVKTAGYKAISQFSANIVSRLLIPEMDCDDEVKLIRKKLRKNKSIQNLQFNLLKKELIVSHSMTPGQLLETINKIGFNAELITDKKIVSATLPNRQSRKQILVILSGLFVFSGLLIEMLTPYELMSILTVSIGIILGGLPIARKGLQEARHFSLGMNFLMTVAVIGAMVIGEWMEAGTVVFLFALAQWLEARSMDKARKSIDSLMDESPETARVILDGVHKNVPVGDVKKNQKVAIKPGEIVPLDGIVIKGSSHIDQSKITGESIVVKKDSGDRVYAGTLNKNGFLEVRVDREYSESTYSRIVHLVMEAQTKKAPRQAFIDRFSQYYTPLVILLAIFVALVPPLLFNQSFIDWFYRALVILVIACPCALVISTPVTIISGLTAAIRNGVLIKGGVFLENFAKLDAIAFDKTGTLTEGKPRVQEIINVGACQAEEILRIVASLESRSQHPIAEAIMTLAKENGISIAEVDNFRAIEGRGIEGTIDGEVYIAGNRRLFEEKGWFDQKIHKDLEIVEDESHTAILIGNHHGILGILSISDSLREESRGMIEDLKKDGVEQIVLLTGDNHRTAEKISRLIGINAFYAELLPEDKMSHIERLKEKYQHVAMVGDGVNDAPSLAAADIGIAMGTGSSDAALDTADIILMNDELGKLKFLKRISSLTLRIIKQNIFIALGLKFVFLALAIPGLATLWMAVFADMGASLLVIFNGLRTLR
jgi:Cd2+/Zn2+-exporting ATPase